MPEQLEGVHWVYFPEESYPFYRVTVLSNLSPFAVPDFAGGQWSLLTETSESHYRPMNSSDALIERVLAALRTATFVPKGCKIESKWYKRLEYGYPVPYDGRDAHFNAVDGELIARGIHSRGRFGAWKYEVANQDHSCAQGVEAVDNILFGSAESTVREPGRTNARYSPHRPLRAQQLYSGDAQPLGVIARWSFVVAHCDELIDDWLDTVVERVIPDGVRFQIIVYEYCEQPIRYSLRENMLHVVRVAAPQYISSVDLVFGE